MKYVIIQNYQGGKIGRSISGKYVFLKDKTSSEYDTISQLLEAINGEQTKKVQRKRSKRTKKETKPTEVVEETFEQVETS